MIREEAIASDDLWAGLLRSAAGAIAGWHHHGDYETAIYVIAGKFLMEFGPGGAESFEAGPGDFIHVPRGAIHREGNPTERVSTLVVVRAGSGVPTINVDGPEPG